MRTAGTKSFWICDSPGQRLEAHAERRRESSACRLNPAYGLFGSAWLLAPGDVGVRTTATPWTPCPWGGRGAAGPMLSGGGR